MIARESMENPPASGLKTPTGSATATKPRKPLARRYSARLLQAEISPSAVRAYLEIDDRSGLLIWRAKPARKIVLGSIAGTPRRDGDRWIGFMGGKWPARVLRYVIRYGEWPVRGWL